MYEMLKHAHSGLRWIVLLLLIVAIFNALLKWRKRDGFSSGDRKISLFAMIFTHIQLLIGLALYFISPKVVMDGAAMKDVVLRFYLVEHFSMMIVAVILITIGFVRTKKINVASGKFKSIFLFYLLGLLVMLAAIPWPFRNLGGGWF